MTNPIDIYDEAFSSIRESWKENNRVELNYAIVEYAKKLAEYSSLYDDNPQQISIEEIVSNIRSVVYKSLPSHVSNRFVTIVLNKNSLIDQLNTNSTEDMELIISELESYDFNVEAV